MSRLWANASLTSSFVLYYSHPIPSATPHAEAAQSKVPAGQREPI